MVPYSLIGAFNKLRRPLAQIDHQSKALKDQFLIFALDRNCPIDQAFLDEMDERLRGIQRAASEARSIGFEMSRELKKGKGRRPVVRGTTKHSAKA